MYLHYTLFLKNLINSLQESLPCTKSEINFTGMFWKTASSSNPGIGPKFKIKWQFKKKYGHFKCVR